MERFQGKNLMVVGAYAGIGRAAAKRLADEGAKIVAVGRQEDKLREVVAELPGEGHEALVADAAKWGEWENVIKAAGRLGRLSGAVVCAGLHEIRPLGVLDAESLARAFEANVTTAMLATRAFTKVAEKQGGSVVWISSVAALRGTATFAAYAAAKGALIAASRVAAVELAARRIRVNVLAAGVVETAMSQAWLAHLSDSQRDELARNHLLGTGRPEDVADVIAFLLSNDSRWMTGSLITVDGGLSSH